jgi:hypothetical protein
LIVVCICLIIDDLGWRRATASGPAIRAPINLGRETWHDTNS